MDDSKFRDFLLQCKEVLDTLDGEIPADKSDHYFLVKVLDKVRVVQGMIEGGLIILREDKQ